MSRELTYRRTTANIDTYQRAAVTSDGLTEETGLIPVDCAFGPSVLLVRSTVRRITSTEVITESRERVSYTQLVLATGSLWNGALALPDSRVKAIEHLRAFRKRLEGAESVVIIGGGAVGIGGYSLSSSVCVGA